MKNNKTKQTYQSNDQNYSPNRYPSYQQLSQINNLPQNIRCILIQNKVLTKQNQILKEQLLIKKRIIQKLKQQIDNTIIEDTKDKLHYIRIIQTEVQLKTQKVLQEYYSNIANFQNNIKTHESQVKTLQNQIRKQRKINQLLAQNVVQLKQYIIQAMTEKDHLIEELKQIIINLNTKKQENLNQSYAEKQQRFQKNIREDEFIAKNNIKPFQNQKVKKPYIIKNQKLQKKRSEERRSLIKIEQDDKKHEPTKIKGKIIAKIIQNK